MSCRITHFYEENSNSKQSLRLGPKNLHTISSLSPKELIFPTPLTSRQTLASKLEAKSHSDLLNISESESILPATSASVTVLNKRFRRSRFDLKKTLRRSKSMCMTHFQSWLQRRRQHQQQHQQLDVLRRKSAVESKEHLPSPSATPKFLGSPRLARIHQRIFKHHPSSPALPPPAPLVTVTDFPVLSSPCRLPPTSDDSDRSFKKQESPVRIYLPARPSSLTRHVRISNNQIAISPPPPMSTITSPIINRRNLSTTAQERRESFVALSTLINNQ